MKVSERNDLAKRETAVSYLSSFPVPISSWESLGNVWPTINGWYNMLRPENLRYELVSAGVVARVNGRWIIFPDAWQEWCKNNHRFRDES